MIFIQLIKILYSKTLTLCKHEEIHIYIYIYLFIYLLQLYNDTFK